MFEHHRYTVHAGGRKVIGLYEKLIGYAEDKTYKQKSYVIEYYLFCRLIPETIRFYFICGSLRSVLAQRKYCRAHNAITGRAAMTGTR